MTYEETDNTISLSGALPTTDATGKVRLTEGEYFDFTVSSKIAGDVNINYEISAKDVTTSDRKIDGSNIKLYLTRLTDDGEEELMTPETYNEEASANNFTGRPSGEMSLYTSSMNSSESNNYRLRMYVDESYNPQGDGGGLTFAVRINIYGKAGDKYVPETTKTLLAANPLEEETVNIFNYTSNGNYANSNLEVSNDPTQVTNGLFEAKDEDGTSYYFRGNVDNNNVQFGTYDKDYYVYEFKSDIFGDIFTKTHYYQTLESCKETEGSDKDCQQVKLASQGDKMYWKIVRVNGDGSLRLIYNGTSANPDNSDLTHSYSVGRVPYNIEYDDPKYAGYTYDNGTDSFIKREVDTWYQNTLGKSSYNNMVTSGRFCSDSSGYQSGSAFGVDNIFASVTRLVRHLMGAENVPSLECPSTNESYGGSYRLKAGLITADELAYAGEVVGVPGDSYLNTKADQHYFYWSMTPTDFDENRAGVGFMADGLGYSDVSGYYAIRPVINVSISCDFTLGDGSSSNPYVIE